MTLEERIAAVVNSPQRRQLFFSKLDDPRFLARLDAAGYFTAAPDVIEDPPGTTSHPPWPEGMYLVRIASKDPAQVAPILARVRTNGNMHAVRARLEAFKRMPGKNIQSFLNVIKADLEREGDESVFHLVPIANELWTAGLRDEAAALIHWAFRPEPVPETKEGSLRPRTKLDASGFEAHEILKGFLLPRLVEDPQRVIDLACNGLQGYLQANYPGQTGARRNDASFIWQEDLDKRDEYGAPQDQLLWLLRTASKTATTPDAVNTLVTRLERKGWSAFRRVALALLADRADALRAEGVERLLNPENYADHTIRPEYVRLLRALSSSLTRDEIENYVAIAEAEVEPAKERADLRKRINREPSDQEVETVRAHELRDRLAPLKDVLPSATRQRFDEWVTTHGPPVFVESAVRMGPTLVGTQPEPLVDEPSFEDLPAALHKLVLEDPKPTRFEWGRENTHERVTERAHKELSTVLGDPTIIDQFPAVYQPDLVRAVAHSARDSAVLEMEFPERILRFVEKAVTLPGVREGSDPSTILNVQRILEAILPKLPKDTPKPHLERVWKLIKTGVGTPYPWGADTTQDRDWFTDGINAGPGKALENVVEFALHVIRTSGNEPGPLEGPFRDDVCSVLRSQVDLGTQPLLAVHAVGGRLLPWIKHIDPEGAKATVEKLYPGSDPNVPAWRAAWEPYVSYTKPFRDLWGLLVPKYRTLLEHPPTWFETDRRQVLEQTAWHLIAYVLADIAKADDRAKVVVSPSSKLRREVLERLGQRFEDKKENETPEHVARAQIFAEELINAALARPDAAAVAGSTSFIVSANGLPVAWRLRLGHKVADAGIEFDEDHRIIEALLAAAETDTSEAVSLLAKILERWHQKTKGGSYWRVQQESKELQQLLRGLDSSNKTLAGHGFKLAETLVAMGFLEFRDDARKLKA